MRELFAFFGRELVGTFREADGVVSFDYTDDYAGTPLSLSLPLGERPPAAAVHAYLDNLLPDHHQVRARWARERGLSSADPFTLLAEYGEDVAGALSLSPDADLGTRDRDPATVIQATNDDIATRIASLAIDDTSWTDPRVRPRMSVAGAQGKFTLARVDDRWFWPTYEFPSTHILKPPPAQKLHGLDELEHAGLELARRVGVPATRSSVDDFLGQSVFLAERWDRAGGAGLHAEDMNQALGRPTADKYSVPAGDIARLLDRHGQAYSFVDQLAFNTALGNCDAHAKNHSVLLAGDRAAVAPIYDTVTTYLWPHFDNRFAMSVGRARHTAELTEKNWRRLAATAALDADAVCDHAFTVMAAVHTTYGEVFDPLVNGDSTRMRMLDDQLSALSRALPTTWAGAGAPPLPNGDAD